MSARGSTAPAVHSVFIVDDDYYTRESITALLSRGEHTRVWGSADSIQDAVGKLTSAVGPLPEVVLLDIQFGSDDRAGIRGLPRILAAAPGARVLVTSVLSGESVVLDAIRAGADGYVWKNESGSGIAQAVAGVAEGRFVMTPAIAGAVMSEAKALRQYVAEVLPGEPEYRDLTAAIKKTLYLYCVCGLSIKEIAAELVVSPHTVQSRIRTAYQIIGAGSRQEAFARLVERERSAVKEG